ncbi:MAG: EI24 domain-containing protein [Sulfurovum sp.]|nr:EI24 domain-containing protein [Sulfurovum sp.]
MKNIMNAMIFGFKEILTWNTMKYALLSGFLVSVVWGFIGYLLWDHMIALSSAIIEFVPFSMVRSNGAWMLSTFLWFQLVIITFALIFAFFGNFILRTVSKEKYTSFSIWVILGSAVFWSVVWFFKGEYFYHQFLQLLTWLPFETVEKGIAFLIAFYFIYNAIVVSMIFLASVFSKPLMSSVEKRHFKEDDVVRDHTFKIVGYTLKDSALYLIASLIAFPLLFIPVINILVQTVLWNYLVKDTMSYDAAALVYEEVDTKEIKGKWKGLGTISFVSILFNFVPILNFFGPFFGEISMFHYLKSIKK